MNLFVREKIILLVYLLFIWRPFCMVDFGRGYCREHLCQGEDYSILSTGGHFVR